MTDLLPKRRPSVRLVTFAWLTVLAISGLVGLKLALDRYHLKRFQAVREGVLYRTGQPTERGLRRLVEQAGVRTIVSLQLFDSRLRHGIIDPGDASGAKESEYVPGLGVRFVQWPMGDEACWPWPTPWQFEAFFRLLDDPTNLPVAIHCAGGRHRTGTLAALYRMEYDRWPAEQAVAEMHSFDFRDLVPMQEYNLLTYLPRPRPDDSTWSKMQTELGPLVGTPRPHHYEEFVRRLRPIIDTPPVQTALVRYLNENRSFALPLVQRLVDRADTQLAGIATEAAVYVLCRPAATTVDLQMAAALVADFGEPAQQARLLQLITEKSHEPTVSSHYAALVAGVTNRYTANRLAYLRPLLEDERLRPESSVRQLRYCDLAVVRLVAISDQVMMHKVPDLAGWEEARANARQWFVEHTAETRLARLVPPAGNKVVRTGDSNGSEDLSRLR